MVDPPGDDQLVTGLDHHLRHRVDEVLTRTLSAHHRDLVVGADQRLAQRLVPGHFRCPRAGDGEAVLELEVVDHVPRHGVGDAPSGGCLGVHDVVGADPLQDRPVLAGGGAGPDLLDPHLGERQDRHDGQFHLAQPHHRLADLIDADLLQRLAIGGVHLDDVGEIVGVTDRLGVIVGDRDQGHPHFSQCLRGGGAEQAQSDDEHSVVRDPTITRSTQQLAAPLGGRNGGGGSAGPVRPQPTPSRPAPGTSTA